MNKEKNTYNQLLNTHLDALYALNKYQEECVNVDLNGSTDCMELRALHNAIAQHFPELISSRRISDGGSNKMTLIAKVEEIKPALELILSEYPRIASSVVGTSLQLMIDELEPQLNFKLLPTYR